jgi:hypothetical protein
VDNNKKILLISPQLIQSETLKQANKIISTGQRMNDLSNMYINVVQ